MKNNSIINFDKLATNSAKTQTFKEGEAIWINLSGFLNETFFMSLYESYPDLLFFEEHRGLKRAFGQTPHDRFYLSLEKSIFHLNDYEGPGVIQIHQLAQCWQDLIGELNDSPYNDFISSVLQLGKYKARYDWHIGFNGSEVSPHIDGSTKLASHLMYFNTSTDWKQDWGGRTLILNSKRTSAMNPTFEDFDEKVGIDFLDNKSLIFKNTPNSWHGVESLKCPANKFRRLFNVIFEIDNADELSLSQRANM